MKLSRLHFALAWLLIMFLTVSISLAQESKDISKPNEQTVPGKAAVARVWHGRTPAAKADTYYAYLNEAGIKKIQAIAGNVGVQVFRRTTGEVTEFTVVSYWESLEAIKKFAGDDIEKTHNLPKDSEYLLELEPTVKHYEVVLNEWKR